MQRLLDHPFASLRSGGPLLLITFIYMEDNFNKPYAGTATTWRPAGVAAHAVFGAGAVPHFALTMLIGQHILKDREQFISSIMLEAV